MKLKNYLKKKFYKLKKDENGGSIIEYGLIIGFSLIAFVIIIGIISSILDWTGSALENLFKIFG